MFLLTQILVKPFQRIFMGSDSKVLPIAKRVLLMFVNESEEVCFFNFLIILSKPVRMPLKYSGTLK